MKNPHILYSFRRCPYAIRARMALRVAGIEYEHREVLLKDKPAELVRVSAKATVPVLVLHDADPEEILEESVDIMRWALAHKDPESWLAGDTAAQERIENWVQQFEVEFKPNLDAYKYGGDKDEAAVQAKMQARLRCEKVLGELNTGLESNAKGSSRCLFGAHQGFADVAVFPFVRQYAAVEPQRFRALELHSLYAWLDGWLEDPRFLGVMDKHPRWQSALNDS